MKLAHKQMEANEVKAAVAKDEKIAEKSSEKIKKQKEDAKELEEIQDAAMGKKKSRRYKPDHVIEGENAKDYIKHTENMQNAFHEEHKIVVDELKQDKQDRLDEEREERAR